MKYHLHILLIFLILSSIGFSQTKSESDDFSYALKLYEEKFYDLAAQQFIKFANNHPTSSKLDEAGYYGGMSLYQLGDYNNARIEFQSVAVNYPKSKRAPESWYMSGESYARLGNMEEAAKSYETVKTLYHNHPKAPLGALKAGDIYINSGDFQKANQLFALIQDRFIESEAYYPSLISQGNLFIKTGEISRAVDILKKVIQSNAGYEFKAQANFFLGLLSEQQGYINDAIKYYSTVRNSFKNNPKYADACINLAKIKIQNTFYSEAIQIINDGLDTNPVNTIKEAMQELLGDAYFLNNKFALAQQSYEKSKTDTKSRENDRRQLKIALCWYKQNNIKKAIQDLESYVENLPDTLNLYQHLSINKYIDWLGEDGNPNAAIIKITNLKNRNYFNQQLRNKLIEYLKSVENWLGIIRELEPVVKSNPNLNETDNYVFSIALAYERLGDYEKSKYFYNKILLEYPSSVYREETIKNIDYLNNFHIKTESVGVGELALIIGDLLADGKKSKLQFQLGKIYFQNLLDYENAINQFNKALKLAENSDIQADIHYYIGRSYFQISQKKNISEQNRKYNLSKAKEYYSAAMENLTTSSMPDKVANDLVECGILLDNPTTQKQINYYSTLVKNYPQSKLLEEWHIKLADIYYNNSDFSNALKEYEYLTSQFKSSKFFPDYLFRSTKIKQLNGEDVIDGYRAVAGDYPDSKYAAEALYRLAENYFSNGQLKEAGLLYEKLNAEYFYTDFAQLAQQNIPDTYVAHQKYNKAIKFYKSELKRIPANDEVLRKLVASDSKINTIFKLGKAYNSKEDWQAARKNLSLYLKLTKNQQFKNEAYLLLGDTYFAINDKQSAIQSYDKVNTDNLEIYKKSLLKKGHAQFEIDKYTDAAATFEKYVKLDDNPQIYSKYIISQIRSGKINVAKSAIKSFKKQHPEQKNYLAAFEFEEGEYLRKNKNYNSAIKIFQNVKKNYKNSDYNDDAAYHEALVYITLNKQQEALDILSTFAKTYKNSDKKGAVFNTLGGIYFRSEKYESAILSFKNAMENPVDKELRKQILSNLIKTYTYVHFWDAALALARDYINEYPSADDIIDKQITISQAYVNLNQFDRAVELLRQARLSADSEKEPEIQFYIGEAYLRAGQYENAIAEFVKIPLLSRKTKLQWEASALYYSGQAYEKMGKISEAVRMYEEIVKRPGIDLILKKDAQKRIEQIKG